MEKKQHFLKALICSLALCTVISLCGCGLATSNKAGEQTKPSTISSEDSNKNESITTNESSETKDTSNSQSSVRENNSTDSNFEHNEYYDVVDTFTSVDMIGATTIIYKIQAKQDVSIESSVLAFDSDGNVIGKSTDDIILTNGKSNYFKYYFDTDITNAKLQPNMEVKNDSFLSGKRNAVEMVKYNLSEDNLFVTFKQVTDKIGTFAKFKLLFYKGDKIVGAEDGYFSTYAKNLKEKDSTDVASIWVFGIDFDNVEYIFEP